jgi:hypothetical protein
MGNLKMNGSTYMVLVNNEYAGWFNIDGPGTELLRAGLSSSPTIIDLEEVEIDLSDLPIAGANYFWSGKNFELRENNGE